MLNFYQAMLPGADLTSAKLTGVDFRYAGLTGADFKDAEVRGANLHSATYSGFTSAQFYATASLSSGRPSRGLY